MPKALQTDQCKAESMKGVCMKIYWFVVYIATQGGTVLLPVT